ncbi:histone deacetylase complex subunit SAP30L isoform X2 [Talpa occidentalis]|uniref:histone deacetylase complex subunit SAP30L isoform X2 n=1 Tax=Talpa occidentalis TaxID=50954 RepID=UPI00189034EE|nr:histone deacetylase complex subunit SAP30L isoform X2 [Talpa occidentalis]
MRCAAAEAAAPLNVAGGVVGLTRPSPSGTCTSAIFTKTSSRACEIKGRGRPATTAEILPSTTLMSLSACHLPEARTALLEVDLFQLQVNTLRRYKRHYKLQTRPGFNKAQLAETVSRHFRNIPVNEKETLAYFIYMVKSNKSRLDPKPEGGKQPE